jgi:hypothetical protein
MKKTVKMIGMAFLLGAFAFVGSSCKKNNSDTTSIKVTMPGVEVVNNEDDRAYIDFNTAGNPMIWSKDDEVMFYNLNTDYTKSVRNVFTIHEGIGSTSGYFVGGVMGEAMDLGFYGFYPASKVVHHPLQEGNSQTFDVPGTQNYVENQMDPTSLVMACQGQAPVDGFNLHQIFGFANIKLRGDRIVKSVVITDRKSNLNGNITLDLPYITDGNAEVLNNRCNELANSSTTYETVWGHIEDMLRDMNYSSVPAETDGKSMKLDCGEGVQLDPTNYTNFVITLRPGALHQGFTITVNYTEGEPDVITKYNPDAEDYAYANGDGTRPRIFCVKPGTVRNYKAN